MLLADPLLAWSAPPPHADDGWNAMRLEALASFATVGSPEPAGGSLLSVSRDLDLDLSASRSLGDLEDVVFPPLSPDPVMDGSPLSTFTVSLCLCPRLSFRRWRLLRPRWSRLLRRVPWHSCARVQWRVPLRRWPALCWRTRMWLLGRLRLSERGCGTCLRWCWPDPRGGRLRGWWPSPTRSVAAGALRGRWRALAPASSSEPSSTGWGIAREGERIGDEAL